MKKGDIYEGIVEKIEFPNKGILHIDGERVVVKNAIPGQKIQCVITKHRKGKSEARGTDDDGLCSKCENRLFRPLGNSWGQGKGEYEDNQQR